MRLVAVKAIALHLALHLLGCTTSQDLGDRDEPEQSDEDRAAEEARKLIDEIADDIDQGFDDVMNPDEPEKQPEDANGEPSTVERGKFQSFQPQTLAYGRVDGELGLAIVSEPGSLGCALGSDEKGAPGGSASLVLVRLPTSDVDHVCPEGTYALRNDPDFCGRDHGAGLPAGCGVFRSWNDDGEQTAELFANGGAVALRWADGKCSVDLTVTFKGGHRIQDDVSLTLDEGAATGDAVCFH
jgi:hypothetical protein